MRLKAGPLGGLGLQHTDLHEETGEVVDAPLVDDLAVLQPVHERHGHLEALAGWLEAEELAHVRALDARDRDNDVAVDHQVVHLNRHVEERVEHLPEGLLRIAAPVHAGARALDHRRVGVVGGEGRGVEVLVGLLTALEEGQDLVVGHAALQLARVRHRRRLLASHSASFARSDLLLLQRQRPVRYDRHRQRRGESRIDQKALAVIGHRVLIAHQRRHRCVEQRTRRLGAECCAVPSTATDIIVPSAAG